MSDVEEIKNYLQNKIKNIKDFEVQIEGKTKYGEGFICNITFIKLVNLKKPEDEIRLVMKSMKPLYMSKKFIKDCFDREITIYTKVYPIFKQMEVEKSPSDPFSGLAECFGFDMSEDKKLLLLENLSDKGYDIWRDHLPLTMEHTKLVVKEFAKWHAFSFALRDQKPEIFNELVPLFQKDMFGTILQNTTLYDNFKLNFVKSIEYLEGYISDNALDWYKSLELQFWSIIMMEDVDPTNKEKFSVITHSDCWKNNFMFKYKDNDVDCEGVSSVCMIDWQCASLALPVNDLSHFLFGNCDKKQLSNLKCLLEIYYDTFSNFLRDLGSDPGKLYPREVFERHWKRYSLKGFVMAPCTIAHIIASGESKESDTLDGPDPLQVIIVKTPEDKTGYRQRLVDMVNYYLEFTF